MLDTLSFNRGLPPLMTGAELAEKISSGILQQPPAKVRSDPDKDQFACPSVAVSSAFKMTP